MSQQIEKRAYSSSSGILKAAIEAAEKAKQALNKSPNEIPSVQTIDQTNKK